MRDPRIYLIRHGETEWNSAGRFQGHLDSPLTSVGRDQVLLAGSKLAAVVTGRIELQSSPLGRAQATADLLRPFCRFSPERTDDRLREVSMGSWDGLSFDGIHRVNPNLIVESQDDWYFRSPDGERYDDVVRRIKKWLDTIDRNVVVVTHGLTSKVIRGCYLKLTRAETLALPIPQGAVWLLRSGTASTL